MKNKLALFDLDGTLFDTRNVNYHSYRQALEELGYTLDYEHFCNKCNGRLYKEFLPELTDGKEETLKIIHDRKKELYSTYLSKAIANNHLFDIARLISSEYYLAVVTTASKKNTYEILEHFNYLDMFDLVLTHEDITNVKPSPDGFIKAMEHFNISPENTIIFEDSNVGIEAARRSKANVFVINTFGKGD